MITRNDNINDTRVTTLAYDRANLRVPEKKRLDKIADIRYGGERRAGRGYRDVPVGKTEKVKERKMDLVQLEI